MRSSEAPPYKHYSWQETLSLCEGVAQHILERGFTPTAIVAVLRGGCFPGLMLSHRLGVRRMFTLSIATTLKESIRSPRRLRIGTQPDYLDLTPGDDVLLVDDVTNTGATLQAAAQIVARRRPKRMLSTCLVWDTVATEGERPIEVCAADFAAQRIHAWAVFPWEVPPDQ